MNRKHMNIFSKVIRSFFVGFAVFSFIVGGFLFTNNVYAGANVLGNYHINPGDNLHPFSSELPLGSSVEFTVVPHNFTNPTYSVTDTFSGQSSIANNINSSGVFFWAPVVSDIGSHSLLITVSGDGSASGAMTVSITVKFDQTITFTNPGDKVYGEAPFTLSATTTSGLPITFSVVSGPATWNGTNLTLTGAGLVTVKASQAGNDSYFAAPDINQTFTVAANSAKDITAFSFPEGNGVITGTNIAVTVPFGTNITTLTPIITLSGGTVSPLSGVAQDFTNPVTYTVTAADGLAQVYVVTVTVAANTVSGNITLFTQSTSLKPGWNVISAPRVVDHHTFSAAEISSNFDIFVLDASNVSGWSTMEGSGQTEFTPLYSYFINNKTGTEQSLSLTYKTGLSPNYRLFQRTFTKAGWYSIGAANPTYIKAQCDGTNDINNVDKILDSLTGNYSTVIDFTDGDFSTNPNSVALSDIWKAAVPSDINQLHDLRTLKGYAIFITKENALFNGFQNDDPISDCQQDLFTTLFMAQRNSSVGSGNLIKGQLGAKIASFVFSTSGVGISGESINVSAITLTSSSTFPFANLLMKVNGVQFGNIKGSVTTNTDYTFNGSSPANIPADGSITIDVYADVLSTATNNGSSYYIKLKDASAVGTITSAVQTLKDTSGNVVSENNINGQAFTILTDGGTLTIAKDSSSPAAYQAVLGKTNQTCAIWRFTGSASSDTNVTVIVVRDIVGTAGNKASFQNLQWYKGGVAVGPVVVSGTASGTSAYAYTFHFISPVVVPQNSGIALELRGDVSTFASGGATSNSVHTFRIESADDVTALSSGTSLSVIVSGPNNGSATDVNPITVARTKLTVTSDATGILTSGHPASSADVMAVFVFTADPGYDATISTVTLKLAGSSLATISVRLIDADTGTDWGSSQQTTFGQSPVVTSISFFPAYTLTAGATKRVKVQANTTMFTVTTGSTSGTLAQWSIDNDTAKNALCWSDGTTGLCSTKAGFNLEAKVLPIYGPAIRY